MKEKDYNTLKDLLADESFRYWIMNDSKADHSFWENWLAEAPERKALVEQAIGILQGLPFTFKDQRPNRKMIQAEWMKMSKRMVNNTQAPTAPPPVLGKRRFLSRIGLIRAAASIVLLATLGVLLQNYVLNPKISIQTPYGKQLSLVLPDSTAITLNANSVMTYRKLNPRKVWLEGEAFFQVRKKPQNNANFLVLTNDLTIEVLGTTFNVNGKENKTEVILEEGRIKLNLKRDFEQEVFMDPGEFVAYSVQKTETIEKRQIIPEQLTSWKDGTLEFEDVKLGEVMKRIEEIYGWRPIYQKEELVNRRISMGLPSNDLETALTMLSRVIGIEIEQVEEERTLLLH